MTMAPRKVDQTILHGDPKRPGNCYAACVATVLGVPLAEVPHIVELGMQLNGTDDKVAWWALTVGFMAARGYWPVQLDSLADAEPGELVLVGGPSPRGVSHQTIYRDGELWHDPHPSRAGLVSIYTDDLIVWRTVGDFDHQPTAVGDAS